ncbi:MAG: Fe-S cluster assembly protein SufD [Candidatus Nitrosopumilus limneticus]|nr:Fe-S cluster assembly protein SufD [Candidatus Nitrosopumilus limneticus]MDA0669535.1 Fe-S cluster assembly protein SufD [Thermoproteota archaeon]HJJ20695.1 Fe-S cluster assembly protein SufD [Nitrosopumilus sp.]MDA0853778.1 Fe-S cluster assembly protein SufD [Thermoproteota archaeon]MDA1123794.1 Fe-S cluster assembly protein SufD [Thermoproteota archaeon]
MSQQLLSKLNTSHIEEISSSRNEPEWLMNYRKNSLSVYVRLPIETSPLYTKYTDVKKMDPEKVSFSTNTADTVPAFLQKRLGELENEICIIQIGTNIHRINLPDELKSKGLVISSISDAIQNNFELVKKALEASNSEDDRFTALNNAAFNSGIFIHIPRNLIIDRSIHFLTCLSEDGHSTISRNIIFADESSKATIVQELYSPNIQTQQAYLELMNTSVGPNAQLDVTTLQMLDQSAVTFSTKRTDLAQDAKVNWYSGLFGSMLSRYKIEYFLNGKGASSNDSEVIFGNNEQSFDIQTNVTHESPSTEGRVVEKSILRNKSKSIFKGMIRIKENASKSNSFLSGRSILLDKDAKSEAIPGLEIFTNDVKATHSASVAQIDEEQIFYLKTRCLTQEEAERTIVEGFLEPLSRKMSFQVRAWIAYLIESKWDNRELGINTDEELAKFVEIEETRYDENSEIEQHYKYR